MPYPAWQALPYRNYRMCRFGVPSTNVKSLNFRLKILVLVDDVVNPCFMMLFVVSSPFKIEMWVRLECDSSFGYCGIRRAGHG